MANKSRSSRICNLLEISCRSVQPNWDLGLSMLNENLGLFAEYNLRTFQVKLKVDAEEFVDDSEDALNEVEAGTSVETDLDDFQFIQGEATAKFRNLTSYASLGLALYF